VRATGREQPLLSAPEVLHRQASGVSCRRARGRKAVPRPMKMHLRLAEGTVCGERGGEGAVRRRAIQWWRWWSWRDGAIGEAARGVRPCGRHAVAGRASRWAGPACAEAQAELMWADMSPEEPSIPTTE